MPLRKTAIAIPEDLLRARRDAEITRRLNELFEDSSIADEQRRDASDLDAMGVPWKRRDVVIRQGGDPQAPFRRGAGFRTGRPPAGSRRPTPLGHDLFWSTAAGRARLADAAVRP